MTDTVSITCSVFALPRKSRHSLGLMIVTPLLWLNSIGSSDDSVELSVQGIISGLLLAKFNT